MGSEVMMRWQGVGSVNSPIVISDDEDESLVERALEYRLSDPQDASEEFLEPFDYGEDEDTVPPRRIKPQPPTPNMSYNGALQSLGDVTGGYVPVILGLQSEHEGRGKRKRILEALEVKPERYAYQDEVPYSKKKPKTAQSQRQEEEDPNQTWNEQPTESKAARKKRRRRERLEAEVNAAIAATTGNNSGPSTQPVASSSHSQFDHPSSSYHHSRTLINHSDAGGRQDYRTHSPSLDRYPPFPLPHDQPGAFAGPTQPFPPIPMPSLSAFPPFMPTPLPLMDPPFDPVALMLQATLLQTLQNGYDQQDHQPLPEVFYGPQPAPPTHPSALPRHLVKKIVGMTVDLDPIKAHGIFSSTSNPTPPLDRTLVMECLPKKFRQVDFVRKWAKRFGPLEHVELDGRCGKALIIWDDAKMAREAWSSPRFQSGDGREHIRVYWYRVAGVEFEEGEIEEWELEDIEKLKVKATLPRPPPPSGSSKQKNTTQTRGPSVVPSANVSSSSQLRPTVTSASSKIHPSRLALFSSPQTHHITPQPPQHESPPPLPHPAAQRSSPVRALNVVGPCTEEAMDIGSDDEPDLSSPPDQFDADAYMVEANEMVPRPLNESIAKPSSFLRTDSSLPPPPLLVHDSSVSSSSESNPSPPPLPPSAEPPPSKVHNAKVSLSAKQKDLEARLARGRLELAARDNTSRTGLGSPVLSTTTNKIQTRSAAVAPDSIVTSSSPSTSTEKLRQLVQASKKTKLVTTGVSHKAAHNAPLSSSSVKESSSLRDSAVSPNIASATLATSTQSPANDVNLDDLATSFIVETIQAVVPLHPSLPPKPISMPPPSKSSEKVELAAKQAALEKHIAETKLLMGKLQTAKTKAEKENIMMELRASSQ